MMTNQNTFLVRLASKSLKYFLLVLFGCDRLRAIKCLRCVTHYSHPHVLTT